MKITAKYLTKVYDKGVYALDGVTVDIDSGSVVSVLGESGCGKTTLLRLLSGLDKPTAGELYLNGVLCTDIPIKQRDTAVVFQEYILYPRMTVWENVAVALGRYGLSREEEDKRVYKALSDFGLLKVKNQLPRVLSGGQQQRVALARATVRNPSLLLFDEPLSNVAPEQRQEYMRHIEFLKKRLPESTFIYVTHNPAEAISVGEKLLIMHEGRVLQYGDKRRVWNNPYNAEVLRTLCGSVTEFEGKFKGGIFKYGEGKSFEFPEVSYEGAATVILNPYNGNKPYLFDVKGNALTGEKKLCLFGGNYDGKCLEFCGLRYTPDENFRLRFIGEYGNVDVGIESTALRTYNLFGDIKISAKKCGDNVYEIAGNKYTIEEAKNFDGAFYFAPTAISLYKDGRRVLANYRVYRQKCRAKADGEKLSLPCGKIECQTTIKGNVEIQFDGRAYASPVKTGGIRALCIAEEDLGGVRLAYCAVKGFDHYVTFYAKPCDKFFGTKKKLRLKIAPNGIAVNRPLK